MTETDASLEAGEAWLKDPAVALAVGANFGYYRRVWSRMLKETDGDLFAAHRRWSWNWPAALVPGLWLLYRKCWLQAAVLIALSVVVTALHLPVMEMVVGATSFLFVGACGNGELLKRTQELVRRAKAEQWSDEELSARGGTSIGALVIVALVCVASIAVTQQQDLRTILARALSTLQDGAPSSVVAPEQTSADATPNTPDAPSAPDAASSAEAASSTPDATSLEQDAEFKAHPATIYAGPITLPDFGGAAKNYVNYHTRITEAAKAGPNFAGHYAMVEIGCGAGCRFVYAVDLQSGSILDFPLGGENAYSLWLTYRPDSAFVTAHWEDHTGPSTICEHDTFVLEGSSFTQLTSQKSSGECE